MNALADYRAFLEAKAQLDGEHGFAPTFEHPDAYDFQSHLVAWAVQQGRAALFADCGLGKGLMALSWAHNIVRHAAKPVLIVAPLSVSLQFVDEGAKFDLPAIRALDGRVPRGAEIVTTNYERLTRFDPNDFAGVVCDESSIIKNFEGARKAEITDFMRRVRYRLLCSATPSPNDYVELGTSSEALGQLGHMDMLGQFFKNDSDGLHPAFGGSPWRFKRHAERAFWRYVCSWARAIRKPSDLGFADRAFVLPELIQVEHVVESARAEGALFAMPATSLAEERAERRATLRSRCERAAEILSAAEVGVSWCHLNDEGDLLTRLIPDAVQIAGTDPDERKEEVFEGFRRGQIRKLVTKPKIAAFGLNWQHANEATYFPDHSFEQHYQAVRRMWRFGQTRRVTMHNVTSQSLAGVTANLRRKAEACEAMFAELVLQMNDALQLDRLTPHVLPMEAPSWL